MKLSIVTPVYNEAKSLPQLHKELTEVLTPLGGEYEIIAVDDGSRDETAQVLDELSRKDTHFKSIIFRANRGQTAALAAGFSHATGDIVIAMDSDLENDPADIPKLLHALEESKADLVSGWRGSRWKDHLLARRLPSYLANRLISSITGLTLHDHGCTLKVYRRSILKDAELYGDMHRFIAAYLWWRGAKVIEVPVNHRPRLYGKSNYGISRTFRVLLDLIVMKFLHTYMDHPIRFFGGAGIISLVIGGAAATAAIALRVLGIRHFVDTPLPILATLFFIIGVQFIMMGVLAEMLMRIYYGSQGKTPYQIKEVRNLG